MTFEQWLKANNITLAPCNCGGPQYGTDHSPDCEWELDAMRRQDQWEEDEAQDDGYDEGMAQGGDAYTDVMYGDSPDY